MNRSLRRYSVAVAVIVSSVFSPGVMAQPFAVNVFSDDLLGEYVLAGDSQIVADKVSVGMQRMNVSDHLHACAAYLTLGDAGSAETYCMAAEKGARRMMRIDRYAGSPNNLQYAMAATNMGVLYALQGKDVEARSLFRRALRAKPWHDSARNNLDILELRAVQAANQQPVTR